MIGQTSKRILGVLGVLGRKKKKRKSERNRKETKNGGKKNRQNFCSNEVYKDVNIREGERIGIQY
jgi:hypothetical protein